MHEVDLQLIGCQGSGIDGLCFKSEQLSIQYGINKHKNYGEASAMKEIKNLTAKNNRFGEVEYESFPMK